MRQTTALELHTWNAQTREWSTSRVAKPSWLQVETSIRALDPAESPVIEIILSEKEQLENCLTA
jgi:hypothetical protein